MSLVIDVCQDAALWDDGYNFVTSVLHGDLAMTCVRDMVDNVLGYAGGRPVDRLNIWDHGTAFSFQVGNDVVELRCFDRFERDFGRLRGRFSARGFMQLCHCWVGQDRPLLLRLAACIDRPVYAGTGKHRAGGWNDDLYVRADPDGTFLSNVPAPQTPVMGQVVRMQRPTMTRRPPPTARRR